MGKHLSVNDFMSAIPGSAGIIATISRRVGCDWHAAKKFIARHPTLQQMYDDECEKILDLAETKLYTAIDNGDLQAVKYYLSTKGKRRGYVERSEVTGADAGVIKIKFDWGDTPGV